MNPSNDKPCRGQSNEQKLMFYLLKVARLHAWHQRIPYEDIEDCALEFTETMLLKQHERLRSQLQNDHFEAWVNRCAHNYVEDFRRRWMRIHAHETQWPLYENEEGSATVRAADTHEATHDALLLRGEVEQRLKRAAQRLASEPRDLFLRHFLNDESLLELAATTGRTPDAIGKVCKRACGSIHATLERQGMTEEDVQEYLNMLERENRGGVTKYVIT